jgi:membrane-associated phospholipid phosphatase
MMLRGIRSATIGHEHERTGHQPEVYGCAAISLVVSLGGRGRASRPRRYSAIAATSTPSLDRALRRLSSAADYSRLSIAAAAILGVTGGRRGREAATMGLSAVAVTATALNLGVKSIVHRRRPDRVAEHVPLPRQVRMPSSPAFPSGHSGAAFAFATGVGHVLPAAGFSAPRGRRAGGVLTRAHRRALSQRRTRRGTPG